jgi:hypothetical protein
LIVSYFGGYVKLPSLIIALIGACGAAGCGIATPFVGGPKRSFTPFIILLWFLLFFGGAILPTLTGVMISSVPLRIRTQANSMASILYNLVGYLPSPLVYGLISQVTEDPKSRTPMIVLMSWTFGGVFFISLALIFRIKKHLNKSTALFETFMVSKLDISSEEEQDNRFRKSENETGYSFSLAIQESDQSEEKDVVEDQVSKLIIPKGRDRAQTENIDELNTSININNITFNVYTTNERYDKVDHSFYIPTKVESVSLLMGNRLNLI